MAARGGVKAPVMLTTIQMRYHKTNAHSTHALAFAAVSDEGSRYGGYAGRGRQSARNSQSVLAGVVVELAIEGNRLALGCNFGVGVVALADDVVATCGADLQDPNNVNCVSVQRQSDPIGFIPGLFLIGGKTYYLSERINPGTVTYEFTTDSKPAYLISGYGRTNIESYDVDWHLLARGQTSHHRA